MAKFEEQIQKKFSDAEIRQIKVISGDAAVDSEKVVELCENADIVFSCAGNVFASGGNSKLQEIWHMYNPWSGANTGQVMEKIVTNVVAARPARFYCITTLGMGGSSPVIRFVLGMVVGWKNIWDYDRADELVRDGIAAGKAWTVVRPAELKGDGVGKFLATEESGIAINGIARADVALFLAGCVGENAWDGKEVQLYKAPAV